MQLNGVNINYIILVLVAGALFLATGYHYILFRQRPSRLLGYYTRYLSITFGYVLFRTVFSGFSPVLYTYLNPDELIQMAAFAFYIKFMGVALQLDPVMDRKPIRFVRQSAYVIGGYMVINTILANLTNYESGWPTSAYIAAKLFIRAYLLSLGTYMVLLAVSRRKEIYYVYITSGALSIIVFGLVSSVVSIGGLKQLIGLTPLSWLVIGFFVDVLFFSGAVGYRIRKEYEEKEQLEVERVKSIYAAREEERNRIARDIHDEMGSSMSSIAIYAKVATAHLQQNREKALYSLSKIESNAAEVMEKTYETIWALQSNYGATESIFQRMAKKAEEMLFLSGIDHHVQVENTECLKKLPYDVQKNYWMIFKEALNNVCKYSKASRCDIRVSLSRESLRMEICDNGIGFDSDQPRSGNGIANMHIRAKEINARLEFRSVLDSGTCIFLELQDPALKPDEHTL